MTALLTQCAAAHPSANAIMILGIISACGLALGALRIHGIGLGIAGVLFSGLFFGHLGLAIDPHMLDLMRDFGLVLFVYSIGMKIGASFLTSLRKEGLSLNLLAVAIVLLGAALTIIISKFGHIDMAAAVGLFAGGTTNTPALAAAQEALKTLASDSARTALPALGYAVSYPFGILGILLSMLLLRHLFKISISTEQTALRDEAGPRSAPLERMNLIVEKIPARGLTIHSLLHEKSLSVSRIQSPGETEPRIAHADTLVQPGDTILAVGTSEELHAFLGEVGHPATSDLRQATGRLAYRWVVVTRDEIIGRTLRDLALEQRYDVGITRLRHLDVERTINPDQQLQFGDTLWVVGEESALHQVETALGNSKTTLDRLNVFPMFIGITLGIIVGHIPISVPGIPTPVQIGIAGGPLLVAILLSHLGNIGRLRWSMPVGASGALRDLGITLFLACVGLKAGSHFVETLVHGDGLYWMACAAVITLLPLLAVGLFARLIMKMNFLKLCGLLAGSMTDPPALAFATSISKSDAPAVAYATVYPITMILRILIVQILVLMFAR